MRRNKNAVTVPEQLSGSSAGEIEGGAIATVGRPGGSTKGVAGIDGTAGHTELSTWQALGMYMMGECNKPGEGVI